MQKRTFTFVAIAIAVVVSLLGAQAAYAGTNSFSSWPVDISQSGWTATGITNKAGDGVWDGANSVNGTSKSADFVAHYQRVTVGGYWDYTAMIIITPGTLGDCSNLGPGWVIDPNDNTKCQIRVDDSGYTYIDRPWIDTTYKCPDGYEGPNQDGKCTKLITDGYYETTPQPVTDPGGYSCPTNVTWSEWYKGMFYSITFSYNKQDNDPHKCHRPDDSHTPPSNWPGKVRGDFNQANPEWLDATYTSPTYADCSTLGNGWELDPTTAHQCRLWHNAVYSLVDKIVDVAGHYGDCPSGYESDPENAARCREWVEGSHFEYADRPKTDPIYGCPEGYSEDPANSSQCRKWVPTGTVETLDVEYIMNEENSIHTPLPPVVCPTCGAGFPVNLENANQLIDARYSRGECIANQKKHCVEVTDPYLFLLSDHQVSILVSQSDAALTKAGIAHRVEKVNGVNMVYIDSQPFQGIDGKTYYELDIPLFIATGGNWVYYDTGTGKRWRDVYGQHSVRQYILCSRSVGPWDVGPDGLVVKNRFGGHVDWDWVAYIHDNYNKSWSDATAWMLKLYTDGKEYLPGYPK